MRRCGECSLCCRLLPIQKGQDRNPTADILKMISNAPPDALEDFPKPAGFKCPHQHFGGCKVYEKRPLGCRLWSCRWLVEDDTQEMRRPDRVGYVIDMMPDFITIQAPNEEPTNIPVVQIWIDPRHREAWRSDDKLWDYMARRGEEGMAIILRFNNKDASIIVPPNMTSDKQWHEVNDHRLKVRKRDET